MPKRKKKEKIQSNPETNKRILDAMNHALEEYEYDLGDLVIVPAGEDDHEPVVKVKFEQYHLAGEAPYPLDKIRHVICPYENIRINVFWRNE